MSKKEKKARYVWLVTVDLVNHTEPNRTQFHVYGAHGNRKRAEDHVNSIVDNRMGRKDFHVSQYKGDEIYRAKMNSSQIDCLDTIVNYVDSYLDCKITDTIKLLRLRVT